MTAWLTGDSMINLNKVSNENLKYLILSILFLLPDSNVAIDFDNASAIAKIIENHPTKDSPESKYHLASIDERSIRRAFNLNKNVVALPSTSGSPSIHGEITSINTTTAENETIVYSGIVHSANERPQNEAFYFTSPKHKT